MLKKKSLTGTVGTGKLMSVAGYPSAQPERAPWWVSSPTSSPRMVNSAGHPSLQAILPMLQAQPESSLPFSDSVIK